jgi:isoamylase
MLGEVVTRIAGSSDLYDDGRHPWNSINFLACHDGFTLYDLVAYDRKHNEENGEENRDGSDCNFSWNSGVEGPTSNPAVNRLRAQRVRNALVALFVSQGVPMIHAGDERMRTQRGNNNAYCQDNEISWLDWALDEPRDALLRFTREMIALRKRHPSLRRNHFFEPGDGEGAQIRWYGETLEPPAWHDPEARVLCFTIAGVEPGEPALHVMLNMASVVKELPLPPRLRWRRVVDTTLEPPHDIVPKGVEVAANRYRLPPFGAAVFEAGG